MALGSPAHLHRPTRDALLEARPTDLQLGAPFTPFLCFFMPTYGFALQKLSDGVPWAITSLLREADSRELRAAAALPLLCSALPFVCYAALPACCPVRSCNVAFTLSVSVLHSTASQYYPACPPHPLNSLLHRSVGINVAGPASCDGSGSPRRMPAAHAAASGRAPERPEGELSGGGRKRAFGCVWQFPRCWRRSNALSLASAVTCLALKPNTDGWWLWLTTCRKKMFFSTTPHSPALPCTTRVVRRQQWNWPRTASCSPNQIPSCSRIPRCWSGCNMRRPRRTPACRGSSATRRPQ